MVVVEERMMDSLTNHDRSVSLRFTLYDSHTETPPSQSPKTQKKIGRALHGSGCQNESPEKPVTN